MPGHRGPARTVPALALALLAAAAAPLGSLVAPASGSAQATVPASGFPWFTEVTGEAGLGAFLHAGYLGPGSIEEEPALFTEFTGPGACWLDHDLDGWLDLYLVNGLYQTDPGRNALLQPRSLLFRNQGDGTFADVADATGTALVGVLQGCVPADYDNDGDPDLLVTGYGGNVLLRNDGGTFTNVTGAAGVRDRECGDFLCWGSSASWLDYDRDGCLDLYVNHFTDFDPADPPEFNGPSVGQVNRLFRNACDGTFEDATHAAGLGAEKKDTWASVAADLDGDGWLDLYVANDGDEADLYLNQQDGTFARVPASAANDDQAGMGTDAADYDHDGRPDLVKTHYVGQYNSVLRATATDYEDLGSTEPFADALPWSGWAAKWLDMNHDGHLDLMVVNGNTEDFGVGAMEHPMLAYANVDGSSFVAAHRETGLEAAGAFVGRGGAWADYDNDGDVDFVLAEAGENPTHLFRSDGAAGHFLNLALAGTGASNRDAVGARVTVRAPGLPVQTVDRVAGVGFLSGSDPRLHVGLGPAWHADLEVRWPDGSTQAFAGVRANQFLRITQGQAVPEVLRSFPRVAAQGPGPELAYGALAGFAGEAEAPPGASIASFGWDFGDGATAPGFQVEHAYRDVGPFVAKARAVDDQGRAGAQGVRVMVRDQLQAALEPDADVFLPTEAVRGNVTVAFSDGAPVRAADVRIVATYRSGHAELDALAPMLPRFLRDLLGYQTFEVEGTTGASGRFAFALPYTLPRLSDGVPVDLNHPGVYRLEVSGGARGSHFEPFAAELRVGVPEPLP